MKITTTIGTCSVSLEVMTDETCQPMRAREYAERTKDLITVAADKVMEMHKEQVREELKVTK